MTLTNLIAEVRRRANMENSTFVSDSEITSYINLSYAELYDILVSRFEDYFSKTSSFTISSGNEQSLPSDFYKMRGLDLVIGDNSYSTIRKFNFEDRNRVYGSVFRTLYRVQDRCYRIMGQKLMIYPTNEGPGDYRMWYIPRYTPLTTGSDTTSDVMDFEEYIIVDAAMKCLVKEESDITALFAVKQGLIKRIESMASNRDTQPDRVTDVTGYANNDFLYWR